MQIVLSRDDLVAAITNYLRDMRIDKIKFEESTIVFGRNHTEYFTSISAISLEISTGTSAL
jgi:hypothetical protein